MINEENKSDIIDGFLLRKLDTKTMAEVEQKMEEDASFRERVELLEALIRQLQWEDTETLRSELKEMHKQYFPEDAKNNTISSGFWSRKRIWLIAASIAIFIAATLLFFVTNQRETPVLAEESIQFKAPVWVNEGGGFGFAGDPDAKVNDSIPIIVFVGSSYQHHYQFDDTLKLYLSEFSSPDQLSLAYNEAINIYLLILDGKRYEVDRGFAQIDTLRAVSGQ